MRLSAAVPTVFFPGCSQSRATRENQPSGASRPAVRLARQAASSCFHWAESAPTSRVDMIAVPASKNNNNKGNLLTLNLLISPPITFQYLSARRAYCSRFLYLDKFSTPDIVNIAIDRDRLRNKWMSANTLYIIDDRLALIRNS